MVGEESALLRESRTLPSSGTVPTNVHHGHQLPPPILLRLHTQQPWCWQRQPRTDTRHVSTVFTWALEMGSVFPRGLPNHPCASITYWISRHVLGLSSVPVSVLF